jgi:putative nucleotidyltransferase with HDIG domain
MTPAFRPSAAAAATPMIDQSASTTFSLPADAPSKAPRRTAEIAARRVLVVDDEEGIRRAIGKFLRTRGFDVVTAESGDEALAQLGQQGFVLMLCDVRMPGLSGVEVVPRALQMDSELAIMMLTAVNDAPTATESLSRGAMDYLMKPVELADLEVAIERALHKRALLIEQRRVERMIREEVAQRTEELEREKEALRDLTVSVAETLINAMEVKDVYLRGHSQRVAELAASMAEELGLSPDAVEQIRIAGRLHDVGKIGTREAVLNKPGSLTPEEFEHVKEHVRIGMDIIAPLKHLGEALNYVQDHHEHWDGTGYPRALSGTQISIGGRILAAADAFDALTSKRAYREPMAPEETIHFLEGHVGRLLDPDIYAALRRVVSRRKTLTFIDP